MFTAKKREYLIVFSFIVLILLLTEYQTQRFMLLGSRFFGWQGSIIQTIALAIYGVCLYKRLINVKTFITTKKIAWTLFSIVFFSQLIFGIFINDIFLMTGKLHLPIPMLIIGGPIYRYEIGFMAILFISTILLVGPGWCSYLCYFGTLDYHASKPAKLHRHLRPKHLHLIKTTGFFIIVLSAILLRLFKISNHTTVLIASIFALMGISIMLLLSLRKKRMYHCTMYCPIHSSAIILKYLNPFRIRVDTNKCKRCMKCVNVCKYFAIFPKDIENGKPNIMCTYCGDCITVCNDNAIQYSFFGNSSYKTRNLYLIIITIVHTVFLGLARI